MRTKSVEKVNIPNGLYSAVWGGWEVTIKGYGEDVTVKVNQGIRTMAWPCTVEVMDGIAYINE